jgi:UDP-N-acetylmuramoylalanine--D-glutamate ligase
VTENNEIILGLGVSGLAAAELLHAQGTRVTVVDNSSSPLVEERAQTLRRLGIEVATACDDLPAGCFDRCVTSPGLRSDSNWIRELESRGTPVISELELGGRHCQCPMLAVTGTNGKSTVAKLCAEALELSGSRVMLAGNFGTPLSAIAIQSADLDWVVVEVSSFQLERVNAFHPQVAIVLNVQQDHLDRHGDMKTYHQTKARLFENMGRGDSGIVPDALSRSLREVIGSTAETQNMEWVTFGTSPSVDYLYADGSICWKSEGCEDSISLRGSELANDVLGVNVAAAVAALRACECPASDIMRAARQFRKLPHRMQVVADLNGIRFVNDSKATNLAALQAALKMCPSQGRLIAGGILKETDLKSVEEMLAKNVRSVYLVGEASTVMKEAWSGVVRCMTCEGLEDAVRDAWHDAKPGETILLSPGCASFDQFRDYQDRGEQFEKIVQSLIEKES